jgi:hypothetical protein
MKIETILTPAELPALIQRDLRATSTFVTALHSPNSLPLVFLVARLRG